jgi:hypothetical protein
MTDAKNLLREGGKLQKVHIELTESSGPVSPMFQYDIHALVEGDEAGLSLSYDEDGAREISFKRPFSQAELDALWAKLIDADAFSLGAALDDAGRARTGVSFNTLEIVVGGAVSLRLEYTTNQLKLPEEAARKRVVDLVKALGETASPAAGLALAAASTTRRRPVALPAGGAAGSPLAPWREASKF